MWDFAQKVIDAQGPEIERMNAMLDAWGQETMGMDGREDMGDMGDMGNRGEGGGRGSMSPGSGSGMNDMMGEDDLRQLEQAQGAEATRLYLEQMIRHHEGAVEMAQDEVDNGQNPQAIQLAQHMVESQKAEITEMEQMLQELPAS